LSSISAVVDDLVEPELDLVAPARHAHRALHQERGELVAADLREDGEQIGEGRRW